tara:strand:+ start:367 stop:534 length:168 start_codon:yes stop_codon:yes gene_type:complete
MKLIDIIPIVFVFGTLTMLAYNAYHHNYQLLALWFLVIVQSITMGGILQKLNNKK